MADTTKYIDYFDIDRQYFPQINDSSIAAAEPDFWKRTYPHETFISMLNGMERVLARLEKRSVWIEGAYGTGKSRCAYTLKKILEAPEDDIRAYWDMYEPLKRKRDLLDKLIGHKRQGVVTAYRYASGSISSPRQLFFAVQESLRTALVAANLYAGENSLKESVIAWIEEPSHKQIFDILLQKPEWAALFPQSNAEEVLRALRGGRSIEELINNIFSMADKEGITALSIDADRLIAWLTDVIDRNHVKLVLVWDEFSDYFKNNRDSLSEFQRLVELVSLKPFYFVVVTHESSHLFYSMDTTWKKVRDRFVIMDIRLPDNIAFDLIGHAFKAKSAAQQHWNRLADELNYRVENARARVMSEAKVTNPQVITDIMPIHPMTALILKNIASAFQSNQRSMFDFIKSTNTQDVRAFQWFIETHGPFDDHPLLTVDMLWHFFYEKGRGDLTRDIRLILDTFPQQNNLREDEQAVLKAILIMQAIDQRLNGAIDLFKPTEQNLSYVFEGIAHLEGTRSANLARGMRDKGILVSRAIGNNRYAYAAAVLAGDQTKIDRHKEQINDNSPTSKLVAEGGLATVLPLSPALRLRFETEPGSGRITPVTETDFTRTINILREKGAGWKFHAVIAFAKNDAEAAAFRRKLKEAVADKQYENIVFIDALSTPLGQEAFEQYVDYSAMAAYYNNNDAATARESADKAKRVLDQGWKNRIYNGQFIVYTYANPEGDRLGNGHGVASVLQSIVMKKFQYLFDFSRGLTETQMKITNAIKQSAKAGIIQVTSGVVVGVETLLFPTAWRLDAYWASPATASLTISRIKVEVDRCVTAAFDRDGHISIGEIYDFLETKYGFAPCNLSAFLTGFLLKEYSGNPYRYSDSSGGHEPMSQDKLAEMIGNYIGKNAKPTYIVKMTADERAFYTLTEKAWGITADSCSSADQAAYAVAVKMRGMGLPVWCLEEADTDGVFDIVAKYIALVQKEGKEAHIKAVEIGRIASARPQLADRLRALLTSENCQKGMRAYLLTFEGGEIIRLARAIGAEDRVIADIQQLFNVKHSCLWDRQTGEDEIRKLLTDYGIVKESNAILNIDAKTLRDACQGWCERLRFLGISCEALQTRYPALAKALDFLLRIYKRVEMLPDQLKELHTELLANGPAIRHLLNNDGQVFAEVYKDYLENLSAEDIALVKSSIGTGLFELPETTCNISVKNKAEECRKNQLKTPLFRLWKDNTGTKTPTDWSKRYRTPALCMVSQDEYAAAKAAFRILNTGLGTDDEVKAALAFLESAQLFGRLHDKKARDDAFMRDIIKEYGALLTDVDKVRDALERCSSDVYGWRDDPAIEKQVKHLAQAEYNAGGSDKVLAKIDRMSDTQAKQYLKRLIKDSVVVGMEILSDGG